MKNLISTLMLTFLMVATISAQEKLGKNIKSEFTVYGVCGDCEKRIEKAALIKGVKMADWNKETLIMKIIYNGRKTDETAIKQSIANIGHDSDEIKASDKAYNELPGCCMYRDGIETH